MAAAGAPVSFDPWKYGTVLPWEKNFVPSEIFVHRVTSLWDKVKLYAGFSHLSLIKTIQKRFDDPLRAVQELQTTTREDLTHFRHDWVRIIQTSQTLITVADNLTKLQTRLNVATNKLPIIIRQIAQLFQAIVFWYCDYEKSIQSFTAKANELKGITDKKKDFKMTLGTMTFNNKPHTLVAYPYTASGQGTIPFSGGVRFDVYAKDQWGDDKCIAGIALANSWVVENEQYRWIECQFHGKKPNEVTASDPALMLISFNNFGKADGFTDEMLQNILLHIFARGDQPELFSYNPYQSGLPISISRSVFEVKYKDRCNSFQHTFKEGPMMPKFWIIDPSQFERKPAAAAQPASK